MSAMNLRGTRLITLSACETGVGEVRNGDGVYGFRRALLLAGARAQLISLWSVNDTATADLMAAFYERAVTKGSTLAAGLRESQKGLMTRHPYYWAAFILSGDGGPLKAN
jgi:CHAT domain-containing protein